MALNISAWSIRKPIPPLVLFAVLIVLGLVSFRSLPITQLPNIDVPVVTVTIAQAGAAPSELETQVARPVEDAVAGLTDGRGVDVVVDVVGGDVFTDSLRSLAPQGRLLVVGFAAGQGIPEVKVNRLLLGNTDVRGVGWGAYAMTRPGYMQQQWHRLAPMIESGVVRPPIGATYDLADFGRALVDMDERRTLGKSVVRVR